MTAVDAPPSWPSHPALFLDLDGTLIEIAERPIAATASARLRAVLADLPEATGGAIAVVSGRPIGDVDRILGAATLATAGIHGLERRDARGEIHAAAVPELPIALREEMGVFVGEHPGLLLEDKSASLALHYRMAPASEPDVLRFVGQLQRHLSADLAILRGRKVIEVKPAVIDKGKAIQAFMAEVPFTGRTPVFIGDDLTDEAGLAVVEAMAGVAVKVGAGLTCARYRLPDVDGVLGWLEELAAGGRS